MTGYFAFDGLLQLSLKVSVLEQKFVQVTDVEVGEAVKGTIKRLTDSALFVTLSGNIDGVVWPNHYADIVLKHPAKRFKTGATIKCRVSGIPTPFCAQVVDKCARSLLLTLTENASR